MLPSEDFCHGFRDIFQGRRGNFPFRDRDNAKDPSRPTLGKASRQTAFAGDGFNLSPEPVERLSGSRAERTDRNGAYVEKTLPLRFLRTSDPTYSPFSSVN